MIGQCPHCKRPLADDIPEELTRSEAIVFDYINRRPGVTVPSIADYLYQLNPNGGPTNAFNNVHVFIWRINKKLPTHRITKVGTGYRLMEKSA